MTLLFIDGAPATADDLAAQALVNYGAYTSFRFETGAVRGLDLHLARLQASSIELFGEAVGEARLRDLMRAAVIGREDGWMRVSLFAPEVSPRTPDWRGQPRVMVGVFPPPPPLTGPLRLEVQTYGREASHLKHVATFGLIRARRLAREAGFDDALFVDDSDVISEGSLWNIGFLSRRHVTWPQAPMLAGVSQALIADNLASAGFTQETRPLSLGDLSGFDAAFITNSATPACAVSSVGDRLLDPAPDRVAALAAAWSAAPAQVI